MSNRWVISWLVIDCWRWVIKAHKFCGLSITRWCNWLLIDDPSITNSSTIILLTKDTFLALLYHLFSFLIVLSVLDAFFLLSEVSVDHVETQSANHKQGRFSIVQYFTFPNSLFNNNNWIVTNQCENETNKYADKNRLHGYRFFLVGVCRQSKTASA